mmetsp:Transcript_6233/g.25005  ORF Transcript_6233/g.25005 Transcript_6233/m.25005 type:complete len:238 (-) Transcript_6233:3523-4236(-)
MPIRSCPPWWLASRTSAACTRKLPRSSLITRPKPTRTRACCALRWTTTARRRRRRVPRERGRSRRQTLSALARRAPSSPRRHSEARSASSWLAMPSSLARSAMRNASCALPSWRRARQRTSAGRPSGRQLRQRPKRSSSRRQRSASLASSPPLQRSSGSSRRPSRRRPRAPKCGSWRRNARSSASTRSSREPGVTGRMPSGTLVPSATAHGAPPRRHRRQPPKCMPRPRPRMPSALV